MKSLAIIIALFVFARGGNNEDIPRREKAVYFKVQQVKEPLTLSNNEVIKFDDVRLNRGNAYKASSGIFVAPVKGVYLFWANLLGYGNEWHTIILKKKGQDLAGGYSVSDRGTATINTIAELDKGDQVWLTHEGNGPANGRRFSYFGGALLFK